MILNANLYTWSYRVAEWAWEAELAQKVADAIKDTSGGEASISETAAEIGGLAAGSVLGALMFAPLELELEPDLEEEQADASPLQHGSVQVPASSATPPKTTTFAPVVASVVAPVVVDAAGTPAAAAAADTPRGRWVLKGYRTEIAFSVHTDPNKVDLAFQANEQSGAEIDNKARTRRPPTPAPGAHPWHDRGPEPE